MGVAVAAAAAAARPDLGVIFIIDNASLGLPGRWA